MRNLKFVSAYLSPVKWMLLLSILLMTLESLSFLSIIGLQQRLIDDVLHAGHYEKWLEITLLFAAAFVAYALLFTFGPHSMHKIVARVHKHLSQQLLSFIYQIPTTRLQKERTATFVHYFSQDIEIVSNMAGNQIPKGIQQIVAALFLVIIIGLASPVILLL